MTRLRLIVLLLINLILAIQNRHRIPSASVPEILPLVPPLTHVAAMSLPTLNPSVMPMRDGLPQALARVMEATRDPRRSQLGTMDQALLVKATQARLNLQNDALALSAILGPQRIEAFIAARPLTSAAYGEIQVWDRTARALSAP